MKTVFEGLDLIELRHCLGVDLVYAFECCIPQCFLMVSQEQASKVMMVEEVFSMVLWLWLRKNLYSFIGRVRLLVVEGSVQFH